MKVGILGCWLSALLIGSFPAFAVIPEPDAILYGPVYFDGVQQTGEDTDVEIIARVDGVADPVGRYRAWGCAASFRQRNPADPMK